MSEGIDSLPWSALRLNGPGIPWAELEAFADRSVESSEVRSRLMGETSPAPAVAGASTRSAAGESSIRLVRSLSKR